MNRRLFKLLLFLAAAFSAWTPAAHADVEHPEPLTAFPQSLLSIRTSQGSILNFMIWTADTPGRDQQGLMYVKQLDLHSGMLFVFPTTQRISMWMKNTFISLDMLFLDSNGRIDFIVPRATPLSLAIIGSPNAERAVIELQGGAAEELGIRVGDRALHKSFGTAK